MLYICLVYAVGFILTAVIGRFVYYLYYKGTGLEYDEFDQTDIVSVCFFWPVVWILAVGILPFYVMYWIVNFITKPRKKV